MKLNDIKKILYKEKPLAKLIRTVSDKNGFFYYYKAKTSLGIISFKIPNKEVVKTLFDKQMPAQLLIRWINL